MRCGRRRRHRRRRTTWPVSCSHEQPLIHLCQWMKQEAGFNMSMNPAIFSDTGRGLMTKKKIKEGEIIVSLPCKLMITTDTVFSSEIGSIIRSWTPLLSPHHCLTIFLMWEKHKLTDSYWFPYINSLPALFTTPAYFSQTELSLLPPSVQQKALKEINKVTDLYASTQMFTKERWKEFYDILTYDDFRWAWYVVNSRSVYFEAEKSDYLFQEEPNNMALAPFLDLLNHSSEVTIQPFFDPDTNCYTIITYTAYCSYQQVFISYGSHSNQKLYIDYGFCLPNNPHDVIEVSYDRLMKFCEKLKISHLERKLTLLRENDLLRELSCSMEGMSWKFRAVVKTMGMDWQQLQNWPKIFTEEIPTNMFNPVSRQLAVDVLQECLTEVVTIETKLKKGKNQFDNPDHLHIIETLLKVEREIITNSLPP